MSKVLDDVLSLHKMQVNKLLMQHAPFCLQQTVSKFSAYIVVSI
jgi:hypothetical protein